MHTLSETGFDLDQDIDLGPDEALVASVFGAVGCVLDLLGRAWCDAKHPRDRHGRFIHTFSLARFSRSGMGEFVGNVLGYDPETGNYRMRVTEVGSGAKNPLNLEHGQIIDVKPSDIDVLGLKARLTRRFTGQNRPDDTHVGRQQASQLTAKEHAALMRAAARVDGLTDNNTTALVSRGLAELDEAIAFHNANNRKAVRDRDGVPTGEWMWKDQMQEGQEWHPDTQPKYQRALDTLDEALDGVMGALRDPDLSDGNRRSLLHTASTLRNSAIRLAEQEDGVAGRQGVNKSLTGTESEHKASLAAKYLFDAEDKPVTDLTGDAAKVSAPRVTVAQGEDHVPDPDSVLSSERRGAPGVEPRAEDPDPQSPLPEVAQQFTVASRVQGLDAVTSALRTDLETVDNRSMLDAEGNPLYVGSIIRVGGDEDGEGAVYGVVQNITNQGRIKYHTWSGNTRSPVLFTSPGSVVASMGAEQFSMRTLMDINAGSKSEVTIEDVLSGVHARGDYGSVQVGHTGGGRSGRAILLPDAQRVERIAPDRDGNGVREGDWVAHAVNGKAVLHRVDSITTTGRVDDNGAPLYQVTLRSPGVQKPKRVLSTKVYFAHSGNNSLNLKGDKALLDSSRHDGFLPTRAEAVQIANDLGDANLAALLADPDATPEDLGAALHDSPAALDLYDRASGIVAKFGDRNAIMANREASAEDLATVERARALTAAASGYYREEDGRNFFEPVSELEPVEAPSPDTPSTPASDVPDAPSPDPDAPSPDAPSPDPAGGYIDPGARAVAFFNTAVLPKEQEGKGKEGLKDKIDSLQWMTERHRALIAQGDLAAAQLLEARARTLLTQGLRYNSALNPIRGTRFWRSLQNPKSSASAVVNGLDDLIRREGLSGQRREAITDRPESDAPDGVDPVADSFAQRLTAALERSPSGDYVFGGDGSPITDGYLVIDKDLGEVAHGASAEDIEQVLSALGPEGLPEGAVINAVRDGDRWSLYTGSRHDDADGARAAAHGNGTNTYYSIADGQQFNLDIDNPDPNVVPDAEPDPRPDVRAVPAGEAPNTARVRAATTRQREVAEKIAEANPRLAGTMAKITSGEDISAAEAERLSKWLSSNPFDPESSPFSSKEEYGVAVRLAAKINETTGGEAMPYPSRATLERRARSYRTSSRRDDPTRLMNDPAKRWDATDEDVTRVADAQSRYRAAMAEANAAYVGGDFQTAADKYTEAHEALADPEVARFAEPLLRARYRAQVQRLGNHAKRLRVTDPALLGKSSSAPGPAPTPAPELPPISAEPMITADMTFTGGGLRSAAKRSNDIIDAAIGAAGGERAAALRRFRKDLNRKYPEGASAADRLRGRADAAEAGASEVRAAAMDLPEGPERSRLLSGSDELGTFAESARVYADGLEVRGAGKGKGTGTGAGKGTGAKAKPRTRSQSQSQSRDAKQDAPEVPEWAQAPQLEDPADADVVSALGDSLLMDPQGRASIVDAAPVTDLMRAVGQGAKESDIAQRLTYGRIVAQFGSVAAFRSALSGATPDQRRRAMEAMARGDASGAAEVLGGGDRSSDSPNLPAAPTPPSTPQERAEARSREAANAGAARTAAAEAGVDLPSDASPVVAAPEDGSTPINQWVEREDPVTGKKMLTMVDARGARISIVESESCAIEEG